MDKLISDLPTQIIATIIASLIIRLVKYIFSKKDRKLFNKRDLIISFISGIIIGIIFIFILPDDSVYNKDSSTIYLKPSMCQILYSPDRDTITENRMTFIERFDTLSKKSLYIYRLKVRKSVLNLYYLANKELPVIKFIISFLEFEGNQKSIYGMDINKVDKLLDDYNIRLCEEIVYSRDNGFDVVIRYILPKKIKILNAKLIDKDDLQKAWVTSLIYNQVLPRYQISSKNVININYSDFLDSIYSNIKSYEKLYDYLPNNLYLWDFVESSLKEYSITGLPKNEYLLTERMKIFVKEIVLNYIIRNIESYSCSVVCKGYTDKSQVMGGIRLSIDSLFLWPEHCCSIGNEIVLNNIDASKMFIKRKGKKLLNNCELSYARGFMGVTYLKELIEKYYQSSAYQNRIIFSYSGMGEDVTCKDEEKKRRVDFKITINK